MHVRRATLIALMVVALFAHSSEAQTSRPARGAAGTSMGAPVRSSFGASETTLVRHRAESVPATRPAAAAAVKQPPRGFDATGVVLSLTVVLALIFALRWLGQRLFGKTVASRASRAVQVLSRNVISPKQQVLVVKVGRRVVVVGDSGQQMNPLCEITDPEEIAALVGQLHEEKRESTGNPFGALFGRAGSTFEREIEPQRPVGVADEDDEESTDGSTGPSPVHDTRDELSGLMDKVRLMSRQFRRT